MGPAVFRILDLPVELIVEIAICAQHIWQEEVLLTHGPHAGAKRLAVEIPRTAVRREACCRSLDRTTVPCCWLASTPKDTLTPARCMAQTCARLRDILLVDNSQIWELDNALYPQPGSPVTTGSAASTATQNRAQNLVVKEACAHALRHVNRPYPCVRKARLALPWDDFDVETDIVGRQIGLQHLDLEIYYSFQAPVRPVIHIFHVEGLQTYRSLNSSLACYSAVLTTMEISHPFARRARFNGLFHGALSACARTLQHLSIDAPSATFAGLRPVVMPELRYLHLVVPAGLSVSLLRSLGLPATVDVHLEPVLEWRRAAFNRKNMSERGAVPFAAIEASWADIPRPYDLWRYMSALAAPDQMARIFLSPPQFTVRDEGLWPRMTAMGLDVRLDPSTTAFERACRRFPEYVSVAFAGSRQEMEQMQNCAGHDSRGSMPPQGKITARRSLTVRDGTYSPQDRVRLLVPSMPAPVYDSIRYIIATAVLGKPRSAFVGTSSVTSFHVHPKSWLPAFSMGWSAVLDAVSSTVKSLALGCPMLDPDVPFTHNAEGCLAPAHLESLAQYLNDFLDALKCPCPKLKRIHVQSSSAARRCLDATVARLDAHFNSSKRIGARARRIVFVVDDA